MDSSRRELVDQETGEVFWVVQEQIKKDGSETLVVTNCDEPVEVQQEPAEVRYGTERPFVLTFGGGFDMFGDVGVTQYEKAVLAELCKLMSYGNKVHATTSGLADLTGIRRQHVNRALKALEDRGAIKRVASNPALPNIPAYRVDVGMVFRGTVDGHKKAIERESRARARLVVLQDRMAA